MDAPVRASVILVTYEHEREIAGCLDSLLPTIGPSDEVIVVDNASTDATLVAAGAYGDRVRIRREPVNRGFGAGANAGARHARGRILVFLGVDTRARPGWLAALVEVLDATAGQALVGARVLLARHPDRIDAVGDDVHVSGIPTSRHWGTRAVAEDRVEEVPAVSGTCFAIARDVHARLGGFDERLFLYWEDVELSLRARLAGHKCLVATRATVLHDHRPGTSPQKLFYLERNRLWGMLTLLNLRTLVALLPVLIVAEAIVWGYAAASGAPFLSAKARAWADVLRWMPHLSAARARAARTRRIADRELLRLHATRLPLAQVRGGPLGAIGEALTTPLFAFARIFADLLAA